MGVIERESSIILEGLSEQAKRQGADALLKLHNEPATNELHAYYKRLEEGSPSWDIDTFIEGVNRFANLSGPGRAKYYGKALKKRITLS